MVRLSDAGQTDVLYNLAKGIGTLRAEKINYHFPIDQIPMGLV